MQNLVVDALGEVKGRFRCRLSSVRSNPIFIGSLLRAEMIVAESFGIVRDDLYRATRGRKSVANARQIMMYLAHVTFGFTLGEVGRLYNRDRSTVGYACRKFEDLRDDPLHDRMLEKLERAICASATTAAAPSDNAAISETGGGA